MLPWWVHLEPTVGVGVPCEEAGGADLDRGPVTVGADVAAELATGEHCGPRAEVGGCAGEGDFDVHAAGEDAAIKIRDGVAGSEDAPDGVVQLRQIILGPDRGKDVEVGVEVVERGGAGQLRRVGVGFAGLDGDVVGGEVDNVATRRWSSESQW